MDDTHTTIPIASLSGTARDEGDAITHFWRGRHPSRLTSQASNAYGRLFMIHNCLDLVEGIGDFG